MVKLLLDSGADVNAFDPANETPLMAVARVGNLDAVRVVLEHGATLDAKDPQFEQTALMVAVRENHPQVVRLLIELGANVNAKTRMGVTPPFILPNSVPGFGHGIGIVRGGSPDRGRRAPTPGAMSPLQYAARDGRLDTVKILLASGADINQVEANDITPVITAITNNHPDVATYLIEQGADVKKVDWYGRTALFAAVETRNMDTDNGPPFENSVTRPPYLPLIQLLLDKGADPNARTAEQLPIRNQFLRTTGTLEWVDFTGMTPFIYAARAGDVDAMKLLLKAGADPKIRNVPWDERPHGGRGRQLGLQPDLLGRRAAEPRSGEALFRSGPHRREQAEFDGGHGADGRGQSWLGRDHQVPGLQRREAGYEGCRRPHGDDLGRRRVPGHESRAGQGLVHRAPHVACETIAASRRAGAGGRRLRTGSQ